MLRYSFSVALLGAAISTAAAAQTISDRTRDTLTDLAIKCFPGSKERPADDLRGCEDAIERWRLLSSADRLPDADRLVEEIAVARREFYEASNAILAKMNASVGKKAAPEVDPAMLQKADAGQQRWRDDIVAIREILRR
ncbi:hypothetical protein [Inquilinus sp.]|uniref:hypothetical protein n=1 Tax=Inquilinus sp. TaxID=1932117 RepID=UPI0031DA1557